MKIGILGGTFDPIHNGHLMIGRYARDLFLLDEIWVIPNGNPPHKAEDDIATNASHRIEMARLAIENEPKFVLQTYEVERKETNYSYLTMEHFKSIHPEYEFYFIIGADSLFSLERWAHPERLLKSCVVLAAFRDGKNLAQMENQISYLNAKYNGDIRLLHTPNVDISSTELRTALRNGTDISEQIPERVLSYIKKYQLYALNENKIVAMLSEQLCKQRWIHTQGVVSCAQELALIYGESVSDARRAALLHDCAKCLSQNQLQEICLSHGVTITESEKQNFELLHAKAGCILAKETYQISDDRILNAILYHTTGRPNMSRLEQIIYVADYIEPNRTKAPNLDDLRRLALTDIDDCTYRICEATLAYLRKNGSVIGPGTEETYLFYKKKSQDKQKG